MLFKIKLNLIAAVIAVTLAVSGGISVADSFPFRSVHIGDVMPKVVVTDVKTQQELDFDSLKGKVYVAVFWGADIPTKKNRSILALKAVQEITAFLEEKSVTALAVNAQNDIVDLINEVIGESAATFPFYNDPAQKVYGDLGIFVMPAVLLVDKENKIVAGMGYSKDMADRLKGEIEILLGEKTREQVEKEIHPEVIEKSAEEKEAIRRLGMANVMQQRGMLDAAIREYLEAIKAKPDISSKPYIELGCIYFDKGQYDEAVKYLDMGLEMEPDSLRAQICMAKITVEDGEIDLAIGDLQTLMMRNSRSPDLHYVLGTFYEKQGKMDLAASEYRKAYELLEQREQMASH